MADTDPLAALDLAPGERVLWQGPARVGAVLPPVRENLVDLGRVVAFTGALATPFALGVIIDATSERPPGPFEPLTGAIVMAGVVAVSVVALQEVARRVGPYYASFVLLALVAPLASFAWSTRVAELGWAGAVFDLDRDDAVVTALIALPLGRIVLGIAGRVSTSYVVTDVRVAAVRVRSLLGRQRVLWQRPVADLRVEASGASALNRLVVGQGLARRELHVRDDPAHVLLEVSAQRDVGTSPGSTSADSTGP